MEKPSAKLQPHENAFVEHELFALLQISCRQHTCNKPGTLTNDLGVYVNTFGKTSVVWRYTLQSIGPSGIALNY